MIIGNGMLANLFINYAHNEEILILASGVSNSKETKSEAFAREFNLIRSTIHNNPDKTIVYFGTSSMYDPISKNSPYVKHKLEMEEYITQYAAKYYIFRISQIIGRANNPTLINFLINNILHGKSFDVWSGSTRNLISIEDVKLIISYIIDHGMYLNSVVNVANSHNIAMPELITIVEQVLNLKANCTYVTKGFPFEKINIEPIMKICIKLGINFNDSTYYINAINHILDVNA